MSLQASTAPAPTRVPMRMARRSVPAAEVKYREDLLRLQMQLDAEYVGGRWRDTHVDIIDFIQPNRGQFWLVDTNRGTRKDVHIINNTAQDASRKLVAAMDVGITSEAREWFIVGCEDPAAADDHGVREYCHQFQTALYAFISRIGFYAPNRSVLSDLVGPGIGLMIVEEDKKKVARCRHIPIGQFRVWTDSSGEVCGFTERFAYTASQMVEEFGDACSPNVLSAVDKGFSQTSKFTVLHVVRERAVRDTQRIDAEHKPWESIWLEIGQGVTTNVSLNGFGDSTEHLGPVGILRESGYDECPFYCPRWDAIGQNAYGTDSPGWMSLGDAKSLQDLEFGGARTLAMIMDPALNVPEGLKNASILPGARNQLPDNAKVKVEVTVVIPPDAVKVFESTVARFERRLDRAMYSELLFLLSSDDHAQPRTAEEIRGKKEERLLQLGGVFARVARELRKVIMRMAAIAQRAGLLPELPQNLTSRRLKLKLDFTNPLVTAQKAIGFTAMSQVVSFGLAAAQAKKGGLDNLDVRKATNIAADMLGAPPDMLLSDEEMQKYDQQLAQHVQSQSQAAALPAAAGAIKDLSNSDPEKLRSLLALFGRQAQAEGVATA